MFLILHGSGFPKLSSCFFFLSLLIWLSLAMMPRYEMNNPDTSNDATMHLAPSRYYLLIVIRLCTLKSACPILKRGSDELSLPPVRTALRLS
ncbi:hypothetical protein V8C26DRAFT_417137 [Trichoderma gracile]